MSKYAMINHVVIFPPGCSARIIAQALIDAEDIKRTVLSTRKSNPDSEVSALLDADVMGAIELHNKRNGF